MSSFCGNNTTVPAMSNDEMKAIFSNGVNPPLLPASLPQLDDNGLVDEQWLKNYVETTLKLSGQLPTPPELKNLKTGDNSPDSINPLAEYTQKEKILQDSIKAEYCFYERQYFAALDSFLQGLSDASLKGRESVNVQSRLDLARFTNQRVTVFTQIVNAISKYRHAKGEEYKTEVNQLNAGFIERSKQFAEQATILNKESSSAELHKRMVDYTVEKNKANTNLLSLYIVLNISAVAILVYISRSS